ncbi:MAG: twin-arginine translocation signal domain-containing protein [Balneolaceae bacterium]
MNRPKQSRREFLKKSAIAGGGVLLSGVPVLKRKSKPEQDIIGHGDFRYRVHKNWGNLDASDTPVNNCHEMVMDSNGRLIMITDEVRNNIIIYDKSGRLLDSWGNEFPGGHGLSIFNEGGEDFLYITDYELGKVFKTTTDGRNVLTIENPHTIGVYEESDPFRPTETAVAPNGDFYVADGYGSQYILQYTQNGEYIRHFGGEGDADNEFSTAHGVCIDDRDKENPRLLCTSRGHNSFKRFTLEGEYLSTIFLPGAFVCRPVIDGDQVYSGVCWSRLRYLNQTPNSGFITILDRNDRVVSNPGGTMPVYREGKLQLMIQEQPVFDHCHDVCIDEDKNIYVCQWNAGKSYPVKLERV